MTVTVNLPAEIEEVWRAQAQAEGVPVDQLVQDLMISNWPRPDPNRLPPEERQRRWEEFLANLPHTDVVLPDEAMERESIYGDHGR